MNFKQLCIYLLFFLLGWTACKNTPKQEEQPTPPTTDEIAHQDSVPDETPKTTQVQVEDNHLMLQYDFLNLSFENVRIDDALQVLDSEGRDTLELLLQPGQYMEDVLVQYSSKIWNKLEIEQREVAKVVVHNRDEYLEVNNWKTYQSAWAPITQLGEGKYRTNGLAEDMNKQFPPFNEKELYAHLSQQKDGEKWANLIRKPQYEDGEKHWAIGITEVQFRLKGLKPGGVKDSKYIFFKIPLQ